MNEKELAPHLDDITRALKGKASKEQIEEELQTYIDVYGVPLGTAKRAIVKKYEGDPQKLYVGTEKKIEDIQGDEMGLDLKGRLVSINEKEIEVDGKPKNIHYGILGDDTGTIPFTIWEDFDFELEKGDAISIGNAYANTWNEKPQINIGSRASMKKLDDDEIPEYSSKPQPCDLKDIREGMRNLIVIARIADVEKKVVNTQDGEKDLYSGVLVDETGKVQFSAWHDFELSKNDVVKIAGGYVRTWRGIPQFSFDEKADVSFLEDDDLPDLEEMEDNSTFTISELARRGGAVGAVIDAVLIDIKDGSGLIFRCPECSRVVQKGACRVHGRVDGEPDMRVKGILDDGTGALTVIMNREITEELLGMDLDEAMDIARDQMNQDVIKADLEEKLIAQPLRTKGNVTSDDYGLMLIADDVSFKTIDVEEEARKILDEVRV
ncbi:MAG: Single-stranded DNA binding protein [Thermoplasmatota archaeon]